MKNIAGRILRRFIVWFFACLIQSVIYGISMTMWNGIYAVIIKGDKVEMSEPILIIVAIVGVLTAFGISDEALGMLAD